MKNVNKTRLKEMCCNIWYRLTLEERERYYYGDGTIQFVSDVANILFMEAEELSEEDLDDILDELAEPDNEED